MHLTERDLGALLHGERTHAAFGEHLATCADCAQRFSAARRAESTTGEQLAILDHSVPRIPARTVMVPARSNSRVPLKQIAAGVTLLFLAVGVAAAVPASPLHRMMLRAVGELRSLRTTVATSSREDQPQGDAGRRSDTNAAVLVVPDSSVEIIFRQGQASGTIRVTLGDESVISLRSLGGSHSFELGRRQILANNLASSGSYLISLPVALSSVVIRIGSDTVFTRAGSDIRTVGRMDARWSFALPLSAGEWKAMTRYRIN